MFGKSQRAVFKPSVYQPGQRTRRMPRWLVLLLVGIGLAPAACFSCRPITARSA